MIYTAPVTHITWKAVEEFCHQGIAEGAYLDYKRDFPSDLGKSIAAMANTFGGVILVGVVEGVDGKPVVPVQGVNLERGLAEKVTNIVLGNITPPVFPEVVVCPNEFQSKAVVVIRVPQSPEAPHAIQSNTRVYLRTGNRNNPEAEATLDQIGWLQNRRAKSVALREHIFNEGVKRSDVLFRFVDRSQGLRVLVPGVQPANLLVKVVPQFPERAFRTPPELATMFRSIRVRDYYGTDHEFPIGDANADLLQDGAFVHAHMESERGRRDYYTELSVFGQYFFRQTLSTNYHGTTLLRATEIFCRVDEFCGSAKMFYEQIGYQGYVLFLVAIYGAHSMPIGQWQPDEVGMSTSPCPDESIGHEASFLVADWDKESNRASLAALKTIAWAYNWDLDDRLVSAYYAKERRR